MNNSTYRFSLDLDKQDSQEYVTVRQGDTAKGLSVLITESGTPYIIADGTTAVLAARKSDGSYIYADCTITDNRIEIVLPATFTGQAGKLFSCIGLSGGDKQLTSPPFTIIIDEQAAPDRT